MFIASGMSDEVRAKLDRITRLWLPRKHRPAEAEDESGNVKEWRLALEGFGKPAPYAGDRSRKGAVSAGVNAFGSSIASERVLPAVPRSCSRCPWRHSRDCLPAPRPRPVCRLPWRCGSGHRPHRFNTPADHHVVHAVPFAACENRTPTPPGDSASPRLVLVLAGTLNSPACGVALSVPQLRPMQSRNCRSQDPRRLRIAHAPPGLCLAGSLREPVTASSSGTPLPSTSWRTSRQAHPPHHGAPTAPSYVRLRPGYARLRWSHTKPGKSGRQALGKSWYHFES